MTLLLFGKIFVRKKSVRVKTTSPQKREIKTDQIQKLGKKLNQSLPKNKKKRLIKIKMVRLVRKILNCYVKAKALSTKVERFNWENLLEHLNGPKKRSVYVKNDKGNVVKVNFGDPNMKIKKSDPGRRKNFRARHNCDNPGPRWKARYWSCKAW